METIQLNTTRLLLRQWREADKSNFSSITADPEVMQFYPSLLTTKESDELADTFAERIARQGWGFWAVELKATNTFIGFVGLNQPEYELPVEQCTEIGWYLDKNYWGRAYALEAAIAALNFAFQHLNLNEVYAFTSTTNHRSIALMERLAMQDTHNNFMNPRVPPTSHLCEHVLYRMTRSNWANSAPVLKIHN